MIRVRLIDNMRQARKEMKRIGAGEKGIKIMAPKAVHRVLKIDSLDVRAANILKQEMLSIGGEAAVSWDSLNKDSESSDVLLMGSLKQYNQLMEKLKEQPFGLPGIASELMNVLEYLDDYPPPLKFGKYSFDWSEKTYIMGILNVTPDSFSGDGLLSKDVDVVEVAGNMVKDGADVLDVGGESTRPGSEPVSVDEELSRVIPVIKKITAAIDVPVSVDTYTPEVAEKAIKAGASIVNDIYGLRSEGMAGLIARKKVPVILMHMQGTPRDMQNNPQYSSVVEDVLEFLSRQIDFGLEAGIKRDNIIVDPGIGFGKSAENNLELINRIQEFKSLGLPVLFGPSHKSFIGKVLDLPVTERLEGTLAAVSAGVFNGANMVRVHDVKESSRAVKLIDSIKRTRYS